jgi:hypothetical protein
MTVLLLLLLLLNRHKTIRRKREPGMTVFASNARRRAEESISETADPSLDA